MTREELLKKNFQWLYEYVREYNSFTNAQISELTLIPQRYFSEYRHMNRTITWRDFETITSTEWFNKYDVCFGDLFSENFITEFIAKNNRGNYANVNYVGNYIFYYLSEAPGGGELRYGVISILNRSPEISCLAVGFREYASAHEFREKLNSHYSESGGLALSDVMQYYREISELSPNKEYFYGKWHASPTQVFFSMKNRSCRDRMDIILNNYNYEHNMRVDYKFGIGACNTVIKYHNTKNAAAIKIIIDRTDVLASHKGEMISLLKSGGDAFNCVSRDMDTQLDTVYHSKQR